MQPSNSDQTSRPWWRVRIASFGYAIKGIKILIATQPHAKFHLFSTLLVVTTGLAIGVTNTDWCLLIIAIGSVWTAEAFNSAVEFLVDLVHPDWNIQAGRIKDLSAGAVLLTSTAAAAVGILIFGERFYKLLYLPLLG